MKKLTLISALLVLAVLLSACGAATNSMLKNEADDFYNGADDSYFYSSSESITMDKVVFEDGGAGYGQITGGSYESPSAPEIQVEKLVYTSDISLEAEDFDTANNTLHATINSLGGIIVSENAYNLGNVGYRSIRITVRIPQEKYDTFLAGLSNDYNVASLSNRVDNLTETYYDNENRLRSYRIQEERLFAMLEKATTVEEMLQIESRLCDVQYQIESLTNTQKTIDNDVKYATFYINLNEVTKYTAPTPKTFGDRLSDTVEDSGETFLEVLEGLLFIFIYLAPYIAIMLVFAVIVLVIVRIIVKKARKKKN